MVQDIKCVRPKLQLQMIRNLEIPSKRHIHLREPETWDVVSALRALTDSSRNNEGICVQDFPSRRTRAPHPRTLPGDTIRTRQRVPSRIRRDTEHTRIEGKSASDHDYRVNGPIAA